MTDLRQETPETAAWQGERNQAAEELLRALPGYDTFRAAVLARLVDTRRSPVMRRGGVWFQHQVVDPAAEHPVVTVRSGLDAEPRVLVDPNALSAARRVPVQLLWTSPSPDGSLLAYAVTAGGTELAEVSLLDVATGSPLPDLVPWSVNFPLSWLPDSSGFWCSARQVVDGAFSMPVYRYLLGHPAPERPLDLPASCIFPRPEVSADGRYVAVASGNTEPRLDHVLTADGLQPLLEGLAGGATGRFVRDDLVAIVDGDAPRGRLVRIPVATSQDKTTWSELLAESADVLRWVEVVDDRIVLGYLRDATARVRVLDLEGVVVAELDLPGEGVVGTVAAGAAHPSLPMFAVGDGEVSFVFSTFVSAPAVYRYVISENLLSLVDPPVLELEGLTVRTIEATSTDGTKVPAHVVHRAHLDLAAPHPTLVHGYGGFNLAWLPSYLGLYAPWVEAGGIYVLPHLRGGSDFGADWWRGGMRENKQNTFDDLFAVAEELVVRGWTSTSQLAVQGESNGGLLAGAAVTQRPDLWAAVVADVPILDVLGMVADPLTYAIGRGEYGDPHDETEAKWLHGYSPVANVRPADYPATLLIAGQNDPRCPAWHARVFLDLLERAQTGTGPLLLRVHQDQGHGAAGAGATADKAAEWLALCAERTGLAV